jgi:hypothetical protein
MDEQLRKIESALDAMVGRRITPFIAGAVLTAWLVCRISMQDRSGDPFGGVDIWPLMGFGVGSTLFIAGFAWFGVRSWKQFRPSSSSSSARINSYQDIVYGQGVRRWALIVWISMAIFGGASRALGPHHLPIRTAASAAVFLEALVFHVILQSVLTFGIALWGGYLWGRLMAAAFGVSRD